MAMGCNDYQKYVQALKSDTVKARREAAAKLQELGPKAQKALPALVEACKDSDEEVRRFAVEAIGFIGKHTREVELAFLDAIRDPSVHVRRATVVAFTRLDAFPSSALPQLAQRLADEDTLVRQLTMSAFEELGHHGVRTLIRVLQHDNSGARICAIKVLSRLGDEAKIAARDLRRVADLDPDPEVSQAAHSALKMIDPPN